MSRERCSCDGLDLETAVMGEDGRVSVVTAACERCHGSGWAGAPYIPTTEQKKKAIEAAIATVENIARQDLAKQVVAANPTFFLNQFIQLLSDKIDLKTLGANAFEKLDAEFKYQLSRRSKS